MTRKIMCYLVDPVTAGEPLGCCQPQQAAPLLPVYSQAVHLDPP
jgi:hypothetical protein